MKKIISLLSALAIFSSMAVTGFAAIPEGKTEDVKTADNKPKIQAWVSQTESYPGYVDIYVKLINAEELTKYSKVNPGGRVTVNGINMIQANLILDGDVFVDGDVWPTKYDSRFTVGNDGTLEPTFQFTPTDAENWIDEASEVPEYLYYVQAKPQDGYDKTNIPLDAVKFDLVKVEYSSYAGVAQSAGLTNYTIYGNEKASPKDYDMACKFTGTSTEWPEDEEVTPVDMVAGVEEIANGPYAGMSTISTPVAEAVAFEGLEKITVECTEDADRVMEWNAPKPLGAGKSNVIAVVAFDKAALAGETFTVKFLGAASAVLKVFTYEVQ